jgi:hypothetical protein
VDDLLAFAAKARAAAKKVIAIYSGTAEPSYTPSDKTCKFCRAKATCPALGKHVEETVGAEFEAIDAYDVSEQAIQPLTNDDLAAKMAAVDLIEDWCKAVRAEVERRLFAGQTVDGYKLVEGKRGHRKWGSEADVENLFKSFRLRQDEMYDLSLISPTKAEKVFKQNPKRWAKVKDLITQSSGKPSVAPVTDKRQAIAVQSVADDFSDFMQTED